MKILKMVLLMILLTSNMYGYYGQKERASITNEYIMMKLCIKDKDGYFTDYIEARDNCACAIKNLSSYIIGKVNRKESGNGIWKTMKSELMTNYERCED